MRFRRSQGNGTSRNPAQFTSYFVVKHLKIPKLNVIIQNLMLVTLNSILLLRNTQTAGAERNIEKCISVRITHQHCKNRTIFGAKIK